MLPITLLFSTLIYAAPMQFAGIRLELNNPLNHNSFSITHDEEFIVRGTNAPNEEKEANIFYVFNKDLTLKDKIDTTKIEVPEGLPSPDVGTAIAVLSVHKILDHYLVLTLGWQENAYVYKTLVFKDLGHQLTYKGLAVWSDNGKSPTFRNFAVTEDGLFGYLQSFEGGKVVGAHWKEIEVQFINDGALLYSLDNDFFDALQTGRGIRSNYTNSWLTTFGDSAFMIDEPENLLNVASRSDSYSFKNKKLIPLDFKDFRSYNSLLNPSERSKSSQDTRKVESESLRRDISFNTGLYKFEDQMVIGYKSPFSKGDNTFNLTLQLLNQDGKATRHPLFYENSWLAGVSNDRIFVVQQLQAGTRDSEEIEYSSFIVTLEDFQQ